MDDFAAGLLRSLSAMAIEGASLENKTRVSSRRNREQDGEQSRRNRELFHRSHPCEGIFESSCGPLEIPSRPSESASRV